MPEFQIVSDFQPTGDQPQAIERLVEGVNDDMIHQTLMGVTGSGKTFTMANVVQELQRPTLVIAHNKTLAAQLATEFKEFFPDNAVEYFVSYYDYYQPEAYGPPQRPLHRKRRRHQRGTRQAPPRRHPRAPHPPRHAHSRVRLPAYSDSARPKSTRASWPTYGAAKFAARPASPASSLTSSTSATTSTSPADASEYAATPSRSSPHIRDHRRPHRVLGRRGRAHRRNGPAHRRDTRRARPDTDIPRQALRHLRRKDADGDGEHPGRTPNPTRHPQARGQAARSPSASNSAPCTTSKLMRETGYCGRRRELLPTPQRPRRGQFPLHPPRLLPRGLSPLH